ncbi:MAG: leucine-rich repeat protein, partial [Acholeplasmatales bacterium]|nr:leucine-rich repeat protein [Acholeplasmatales bacterium]
MFFLSIGFVKVYADTNSSSDLDINSKELYDQTNTYNYKYDVTLPTGIETKNGVDRDFKGESRYNIIDENGNILAKNGNQVMDGIPQITVFTHGWQGNSGSWGFGKDSLVTILQKQFNANIYTLDFYARDRYTSDHEFVLYDSTDLYVNGGKNNSVNTVDTNKPAILVFNGVNTGYRHEYIYTQFNYAVSKVVYEYKMANNGLLPKLNLIGHSRGGLTNMQYALDHPDMVASLFSFGTPYLGTTTAELDYNNLSIGNEHSLGMRLFEVAKDEESKACYGEQDLADPNLYMKYVTRWNTYYDQLYSGISAYALGDVTALNYILGIFENMWFTPLCDFLCEKCGNFIGGNVTGLLQTTLNTIIVTTLNLAYVGGKVSSKLNAKAMLQNVVNDILIAYPIVAEFISDTTGVLFDVLDLVYTELEMRPFCDPFIVWNSDFAVNIESQMASRVLNGDLVEYKGFNRHYVTFTTYNTYADNITHCKEMFNPELQKYVLNNITQAPYWAYTSLGGDSISIDGFYGCTSSSKLVIPSTITSDGKTYTVKGISDYAFANDAYGKEYNEIVIPSTVETIGYKAFYNSPSLTKVDLSSATSLKSIGEDCFGLETPSDSNGVDTVVLPNSVESIGARAFANNKNLEKINIPTNTTIIGEGAFSGTSISEITGNSSYEWNNGILIDKNGAANRYELPVISDILVPEKAPSPIIVVLVG